MLDMRSVLVEEKGGDTYRDRVKVEYMRSGLVIGRC